MCLDISPSIRYLNDSSNPKDLQTTLDRVFGKHNEDPSSNLENDSSSSMISLSQNVSTYTFSDEVDHDEEVSHTVHVAAALFDSNAS